MKTNRISVCRSLAFALSVVTGLLTANLANAANVAVRWTLPMTWNDGTPLAISEIVGENVYCGLTSGDYSTKRSTLGAATQIVFDPGTDKFCVVTVIATRGAGTIDAVTRESEYSAEVALNLPSPSRMTTVTVERTVPSLCTVSTTCTGVWK